MLPCFRDNEGTRRASLRHESVLDQPGLLRSGLLGRLLGENLREQVDRLDIPPLPALIRHGDHGDPLLRRRRIRDGLGLREHRDRGLGVLRKEEIPFGNAAGDLEVDEALRHAVSAREFFLQGVHSALE